MVTKFIYCDRVRVVIESVDWTSNWQPVKAVPSGPINGAVMAAITSFKESQKTGRLACEKQIELNLIRKALSILNCIQLSPQALQCLRVRQVRPLRPRASVREQRNGTSKSRW